MPSRFLLILLLLSPFFAQAKVYKCVDAGGRVSFQQTSCDGESVQQQTDSRPPASSTTGKTAPKVKNSHRTLVEKARNSGDASRRDASRSVGKP